MEIQRYLIGALLFALVWASIAYTQGHITEFRQLAIGILFFVAVGTTLSWGIARLLRWYRDRK